MQADFKYCTRYPKKEHKKAAVGVYSARKRRFLKPKMPKCCATSLENRQVSCGFRLCLMELFCSSKTALHPSSELFFVRTTHKIRARLTPWADL
jgi:hypothetical protein